MAPALEKASWPPLPPALEKAAAPVATASKASVLPKAAALEKALPVSKNKIVPRAAALQKAAAELPPAELHPAEGPPVAESLSSSLSETLVMSTSLLARVSLSESDNDEPGPALKKVHKVNPEVKYWLFFVYKHCITYLSVQYTFSTQPFATQCSQILSITNLLQGC